jgi:hypothetical protein
LLRHDGHGGLQVGLGVALLPWLRTAIINLKAKYAAEWSIAIRQKVELI